MKSHLLLMVIAAGLLGSVLESQGRPTTPPRTTTPPTISTPGMRLVPTSSVSGLVVDETGRPIPNTAIRLVGDSTVQTLVTDSKGQFSYQNVTPGEYVLVANKHGFYDGAYGKRRSSGTPLPFSILATESMTNLQIRLFRAAVITGVVVDEGNEPIPGVNVIAVRRTFTDGEWRYSSVASSTTDDRGEYRLYGLEPGEFLVSTPTIQVTGADGSIEAAPHDQDLKAGSAYPTLYFPASRHFLLALPITVASGEVRYGVDFRWSAVPARSVSGRLIGDPSMINNQLVRLVLIDSKVIEGSGDAAATVSAIDGTFTFHRVPAGEYRLEAGTAFLRGAEQVPEVHWGRAEVVIIDADVKNVSVEMHGPHVLSGFVDWDPDASGTPGFAATSVPLTLVPAAPGLSPVTKLKIEASGEFVQPNLIPGRYYIRVGVLPPGAFLKTISADGRNALDAPIDLANGNVDSVSVVLTDRATEIAGSVRSAALLPSAGAAVIVVPVGSTTWTPNRSRYVRASTNGEYAIRGLPAGEYLIVAVDDAAIEGVQDPRVLSQLRTLATRVTLRNAESVLLPLQVSQIRR